MLPVRRAVIDVGTNSIKLLIAEVLGQDVQPVREERKQTRLGRGFYETHRLQSTAIHATAKAVADFAATARHHEAASIRVIATSAARDATNQAELVSAIESASGLKVEILSGEREAEWAFHGATSDARFRQGPLLLLDVGGGSTECILGCGEHQHFRQSFPLGTVRLLEQLPHSDPPQPAELAACRNWVQDFLERKVRPHLAPALRREATAQRSAESTSESGERSAQLLPQVHPDQAQLVATGGTASLLGSMEARLDRFDRQRIEQVRLTLVQVRSQVELLWRLPLAQRQHLPGLPRERADVILTGAAICEAFMLEFGFSELQISTRGLRFAAVMAP